MKLNDAIAIAFSYPRNAAEPGSDREYDLKHAHDMLLAMADDCFERRDKLRAERRKQGADPSPIISDIGRREAAETLRNLAVTGAVSWDA